MHQDLLQNVFLKAWAQLGVLSYGSDTKASLALCIRMPALPECLCPLFISVRSDKKKK